MVRDFQLQINGETISIPETRLVKSKFFADLIQTYPDANISFPPQFSNVGDIYLSYLKSTPLSVADSNKLKLCFELCHFLEDDSFFSFCIGELFKHWDDTNQMIHLLHPNLQYEIYLRLPLILIPDSYWKPHLDQIPTFLTNWISRNDNKGIKIGRRRYKYEIKRDSNDGKLIFIIPFSKLSTQSRFKLHGTFLSWVNNSNRSDESDDDDNTNEKRVLRVMHEYRNDVRHGLSLVWYANGVLCSSMPVKNGQQHGTFRSYYSNGNPRSENNYREGKTHGSFRKWHNSHIPGQLGQLKSDLTFDNGRLVSNNLTLQH